MAAGTLGAVVTAIALRSPFQPGHWPGCPLHALTGLNCPFCGVTRATWALAHLRFGLMLHADALYPLMVVAVVWGWLAWVGRASGWWTLPPLPSSRRAGFVFGALAIAFAVVRNVPGVLAGSLAPPSRL
jgi:hypothetical protein